MPRQRLKYISASYSTLITQRIILVISLAESLLYSFSLQFVNEHELILKNNSTKYCLLASEQGWRQDVSALGFAGADLRDNL
jgi:hypothetical protein